MQITEEYLNNLITTYQQQKANLIAQVNAIEGAIRQCNLFIDEIKVTTTELDTEE